MPPKAGAGEEKTPQQKLDSGLKALADEGGKNYPNMDELPEFTDGIVLANIREYYERVPDAPKEPPVAGNNGWSPIFTQVGPILIALNPFVHNFPMYGQNWQDAYHKAGAAGLIHTAWRTYGPHCFATIEQVYQELKRAPQQAVVICGESGAGKTFTNKLMLEYLLDKGSALGRLRAMSQSRSKLSASPSMKGTNSSRMAPTPTTSPEETKAAVGAANNLLEAFGNAKTSRNDNSSRFGKFTQLYFKDVGSAMAVHYPKVKTYLLERSRVVQVPAGERNYHIFHYLAQESSLKETMGSSYHKTTFEYIKEAAKVPKNEFKDGKPLPFDDVDGYVTLKVQMAEAGFSEEYMKNMFKLITGVMYLGNTKFQDGDDSRAEACSVDPSSADTFKVACELLGVNQNGMRKALTHAMMPTTNAEGRLEMTLLPSYKKAEAEAQRDAVAKQVYSKIFDDVVAMMNETLSKGKQGGGKYIGLLDIFGFEDMPKNGFEQMFINLTNETIQQLFNDVFFSLELEVYQAEGVDIDASSVKQDSGPALDLFCESHGSRFGIIKKLNDLATSKNNKPLDGEGLVGAWNTQLNVYQKYIQCQPQSGSDFMVAKKKKVDKWQARGLKIADVNYSQCFMVDHYAGKVIYTIEDFVPKSKDKLASHISELLGTSENPHMAKIMGHGEDEAGSQKVQKSVGLAFKEDLDQLITTLRSGPSVFVRCIKPKARADDQFNVEEVFEQLKNGGVIAALDIRSKGFPDRKEYIEFVNEFWCLERGNVKGADMRDSTTPPKDRVAALLKMFVGVESETTYKLGHTKAFMKTGILGRLREAKDVIRDRCARMLRRKWRAVNGMNVVSAMDAFEARIGQVEKNSEMQEVNEVGLIKDGAKAASDLLRLAYDKLQKDPEKLRALESAKACKGRMLTKQAELDLAKIGDSMKAEMIELEKKVSGLEGTLSQILERRTKALDRVAALVIEKRLESDKLLESVQEVKACCRNQNDPKQKQCAERCDQAHVKLTKMLQEDFPKLSKEAIDQYIKNFSAADLKNDTPNVKLPARVAEIMAESKKTVDEVMKVGSELLEKKRKFEHEAYNASPDLTDLHERRQHAKEHVHNMQDAAQEAFKCGFNLLADAIAKCESLDQEIERIKAEFSDPQLFIKKIKEYIAAEASTRDAIEKVEQLKKEKAERDEQVRKNLFSSFAKSHELVHLHNQLHKQFETLAVHLEDLLAADKDNVDGMLGERAAKESFHGLIVDVMGKLDELKFSDGAGMGESKVVGMRFCYRGPWSVERFKLLGAEAADYEGMARILDKAAFPKIMDAVEALNAGVVHVDGGYCIAWSDVWKRYYILFTAEAEAKVNEMLADTADEVAAKQHSARAKLFRKAVGGAVRALDAQGFRDKLAQQNKEQEERIRAAVKDEMEKNFGQRVELETENASAEIQEELRTKTAAVEKQKQEALAQKERAEAAFKAHIDYLMRELERVQIRTGILGQMPALYAHLIDINKECRKLRNFCEQVRDSATCELEDMQEARMGCQQMINNPESMPGLRDLIQTLARCQRRHAGAESLAADLALESEYSHLGHARQQMTEVALKIKRVCDGSVTIGNGLQEELTAIHHLLLECKFTFDEIRKDFDTWFLRLDNAVGHIEHAMLLIDVKTSQMQSLKGTMGAGGGSAAFWDKMFSGVLESFCKDGKTPQPKSTPLKLAGPGGGIDELVAATEHRRKPMASKPAPASMESGHARKRISQFNFDLGDCVEDIQTKQFKGIVRFMGSTKFAAGDWVGVDLDVPIGKNDGTVNGIPYFRCKPRHGIFIRPNSLVKAFDNKGHDLIDPVGLEALRTR